MGLARCIQERSAGPGYILAEYELHEKEMRYSDDT